MPCGRECEEAWLSHSRAVGCCDESRAPKGICSDGIPGVLLEQLEKGSGLKWPLLMKLYDKLYCFWN